MLMHEKTCVIPIFRRSWVHSQVWQHSVVEIFPFSPLRIQEYTPKVLINGKCDKINRLHLFYLI